MKEENVRSLLMAWTNKITEEKASVVKNKLKEPSDERLDDLLTLELKNPTTLVLVSLFFGSLGIDCFMLGQTGKGICKLLFGWLTLGIWWLVDVCTVAKKTKDYNANKILLAI